MIRVIIPFHLRTLAQSDREIKLDVAAPVTQRTIINAIEAKFPVLKGTIRDHGSDKRRAMVRFFACEKDLSNEPPDDPVPQRVATGEEPFMIVGAIAGG